MMINFKCMMVAQNFGVRNSISSSQQKYLFFIFPLRKLCANSRTRCANCAPYGLSGNTAKHSILKSTVQWYCFSTLQNTPLLSESLDVGIRINPQNNLYTQAPLIIVEYILNHVTCRCEYLGPVREVPWFSASIHIIMKYSYMHIYDHS